MDHVRATELDRRSLLRIVLSGAMATCMQVWRPSAVHATPLPEGRLRLSHAQTGERVDIGYRDRDGRYDRAAIDELNSFLRCHYSKKVAMMDLRVIEILNTLHKQVGSDKEIVVHSAYRSPEYHAYLIRHNRRAARHSFHVSGQAIDFHIQDVSLRELRQKALRLGRGGVGYYPRKRFLHVDCGPPRYW